MYRISFFFLGFRWQELAAEWIVLLIFLLTGDNDLVHPTADDHLVDSPDTKEDDDGRSPWGYFVYSPEYDSASQVWQLLKNSNWD